MKRLIFALILICGLVGSAYATDITLNATSVPNFNSANLGPVVTENAVVTAGSAIVTSNNKFPARLVGLGGFKILLDGVEYQVANVDSVGQITLNKLYAGTSTGVVFKIYPVITFRIFSSLSFVPKGKTTVVQAGSPGTPNGFYRKVGVSVIQANGIYTAYIPSITLDATTDALNIASTDQPYNAGFYTVEGAKIADYGCFPAFAVPATPLAWEWSDLCSYNRPLARVAADGTSLNRDQILAIITSQIRTSTDPVAYAADYGAVSDYKAATASINVGTKTLTNIQGQTITSADKGKTIAIAGASNGDGPGLKVLISTITDVPAVGNVTIADAAGISVTNAQIIYGSDLTTALQKAQTYLLGTYGGGTVAIAPGDFMLSQFTVSNGIRLKGAGMRGTTLHSAYGNTYNQPIDGIVRIRNPINASTPADIYLEDFKVDAFARQDYQSCIDDVGSSYLRIRRVWVVGCHYGIALDQSELTSVTEGIFEAYDEGRDNGFGSPGHFVGGADPILLGWTKTGSAATGVEPMVFPDDCYQCGRISFNTLSSNDATYFSKSLVPGAFKKGFMAKLRVPEVTTFNGGRSFTHRFADGSHGIEINWVGANGSGIPQFKINNTGSTYTIGLSDEMMITILPGGITANVYKTGTYGVDTLVATVTLPVAGDYGIFWGDLDSTTGNNAAGYWQGFEWHTSWPVATGLWMPGGDDHWRSRESKTAAFTNSSNGGSIRSGDNQIICPGCSMAVSDVNKYVSLVDPLNRSHSVSGTVTAYYGDAYVWLTADVNASATTIPVSGDPRYAGNPVWIYFGLEAMYCTGYSAGNLTGCVRGLRGTTAVSHSYVDGHTVSLNVYRTWIISTTSSNTIDGDVTYTPAGGPEFVNVIQITKNEFNGGDIQIDDSGGYTHNINENNFNGGGTALLITGSHEVHVGASDFESQASWPMRFGGGGVQRATWSGSPFSIFVTTNSIGVGKNTAGVKIDAGNNISFTGNSFAGGFGTSIWNASNGSVYRLLSFGNTTQGARLFQQIGQYVIGSALGNAVPLRTNGALGIQDTKDHFNRVVSGPMEIHYRDQGAEEEPRGALATIAAGSSTLTITPRYTQTSFSASDVNKTILIEYAGTPDAGSSVLTTTISAYIDSTHVTLATPAVQAANLTNVVWYRPGSKTAALHFYDDFDKDGSNGIPTNLYFRFLGLGTYTANRTVTLIDKSGYLGVTSVLLGTNQWLYSDSNGLISGSTNATLDSTGTGMVRRLNIKAGAASGTNVMLEMQNSSATPVWDWFYDYTGGWLTLQDGNYSRQQMTIIPNATYDYLQLHANEGINWNGYSVASYSSSAGLEKFANNVVAVNRGKKTVDGGALGDFFARRLRLQGSGASTSVYTEFLGTPTGINQITIPDYAGTASYLVTSSAALTAGRVPFAVAIGSGVGVVDDPALLFNPSISGTGNPRLTITASGSNQTAQLDIVPSGSGSAQIRMLTGTGSLTFSNNAGTTVAFQPLGLNGLLVVGSASAVNYLQINNAATGNPVIFNGTGTDANVDLNIYGKGTGTVKILPQSASAIGQIIKLAPAQSADALQVQDSSGAVGLLYNNDISGTGNPRLQITARGTNQAVQIIGLPTGTGGLSFIQNIGTGATNITNVAGATIALQPLNLNGLVLTGTASAVNYVSIVNAITGNPAILGATGSDAIVNLKLGYKGAGVILINSTATGIAENTAGLLEINNGTAGTFRDLKVRQHYVDATMTAGGTTGAQTINKSAGSVNFAATATSLVVTNSLVTVNSILVCTVQTNDSALKSVQCVAGAGSFTMYGNAAANAETKVSFLVINQ